MDILLKAATVADSSSPFHLQTKDIFIQGGFVTEVGDINTSADRVIALDGLHISPGWTDIFSNFCDPGFEAFETFSSGSLAAAAGGYTDVFLIPNTAPVVDSKSGVEYIGQAGTKQSISLHPIGAITKNIGGKELAEMYDMHQSGAVAFSDGTSSLQSSGVLLKALQYVKAINGTIIQIPDDYSISSYGLVNEGIASTRAGLQGKPAIAEEIMVLRDIELARYSSANIHLTGLSTAKSIQLIKMAKAEGLSITCSVTPFHLFFTDDDIAGYDANFKVSPPLRTAHDRAALREGILDGTIDCIASHHMPQHIDGKMVEFEYARYGMIGLETCFGAVKTAIPQLTPEQLIKLFCASPRRLFNLPQPCIKPGEAACFTLFQPDVEWTPYQFLSKAKNTPFINQTLVGRPAGIINKDSLFLKS